MCMAFKKKPSILASTKSISKCLQPQPGTEEASQNQIPVFTSEFYHSSAVYPSMSLRIFTLKTEKIMIMMY